jgi:hypothetical protein
MKRWLRWIALAGNVLFILWVLYNGIDEGFRGSRPEIASMIALVALLALDSALIVSRRDR